LATTGKRASRRNPGRRVIAPAGVSLERALSKLGFASRSEARELIVDGRVTVDGRPVRDPSLRVTPERIAVAIDGVEQRQAARHVTVALHKPRGYVTTRSDPDGRKTVYELLTGLEERVVPVGRLDLATSGLLLFTTDTQLANWLTDPATAIPRVYLVTVDGKVAGDIVERLERGLTIDGERLAASRAEVRKASGKESHLVVTLTEGKNREVRRLLDALDHPVTRLRRVQFGGIELGELAPGAWRPVTAAELTAAFPGYMARKRVPRPK
jgi:23S rRNA pseudouridine2605 synthase